jgi:hypothetical protein
MANTLPGHLRRMDQDPSGFKTNPHHLIPGPHTRRNAIGARWTEGRSVRAARSGNIRLGKLSNVYRLV